MRCDKRTIIILFALGLLTAWPLACAWRPTMVRPTATLPDPSVTARPLSPLVPPAEEAAGTGSRLAIAALNGFVDGGGAIHVVGHVVNGTDANQRWIKVACSFYDDGGALAAVEQAPAYIDTLLPGEQAPFKISLWEPPPGIDTYAVSATGQETSEGPFVDIAFVQESGIVEGRDLTIIGEVMNRGQVPASQARVAAAIYDERGTMVDAAFTYARQEVMLPGDTAPFKLFIAETGAPPARYELIAYAARAGDDEVRRMADVEVESFRSYTTPLDELVLVGEVTNVGRQHAVFVKVVASFYNEHGALLAVEWSYVWADVLAPGARSPFRIALYGTPEDVQRWAVWAEGEESSDPAVGALRLEDTETVLGSDLVATVNGAVVNGGTEAMANIQVAATVYDADGQVVAVDWVWLDGDLAPGARMPFAIAAEASAAAQSTALYVQGRPSRP
jgi:hypothetical protein